MGGGVRYGWNTALEEDMFDSWVFFGKGSDDFIAAWAQVGSPSFISVAVILNNIRGKS
jgi:hypothetical protein